MRDGLAALLGVGLALVVALTLTGRVEARQVVEQAEQVTNREVSGINEPSGLDAGALARNVERLREAVGSDAFDSIRNPERYAGVPVSPYQ